MKAKTISLIVLSLGLSFGAISCSPSPEPVPAPSPSASPSVEVKKEIPNRVMDYAEPLQVEDEVVFSDPDTLITTTENNTFVINGYGNVPLTPSGYEPADGEMFHVITYESTSPRNANAYEPTITALVNGEPVGSPLNLYVNGSILVSAEEDADITLRFVIKNSETGQEETRYLDFKTGKEQPEPTRIP